MKKNRTIFRLLFLLIIELCIFVTPSYAASSSKSAVLTIYACGEGGSSALRNSGHAWITIKNISSKKIQFLSYTIKPRETISLSKWSESNIGEGGVYLNREQLVCGGTQTTSYSMKITTAQLKKIAKATPAESTYNALWYNCTTYSTNMWNLVADRSHQISDGMFSIDIPGTVAKKIASWKGAKKTTYRKASGKHWTDVYFITKTGKLKCVDAIMIDPVSMSLGVNKKKIITASFKYSKELNKKINWTSSNKKIAKVKSGAVTGKKKGAVTITAKYGKLTAKCKVTVRNVQAKVVNTVKLDRRWANGNEYNTVRAYDSSGKQVWSYECSSRTARMTFKASILVGKNYAYVIENSQYTKLDKQTGKVLVQTPVQIGESPQACLDSTENVYAIGGFDGGCVYCIKNDGSIKWKCQLISNWSQSSPSKVEGSILTVETDAAFWGSTYYKSVLINIATGQVIRYIPS